MAETAGYQFFQESVARMQRPAGKQRCAFSHVSVSLGPAIMPTLSDGSSHKAGPAAVDEGVTS
jgi:hypothetical protein